MTKEELEREYYGRRPTEPYSEDDSPNDYCYEDKDGDCCCDKTKEEIENDIEVYQECMRNEEELLVEEMEKLLNG